MPAASGECGLTRASAAWQGTDRAEGPRHLEEIRRVAPAPVVHFDDVDRRVVPVVLLQLLPAPGALVGVDRDANLRRIESQAAWVGSGGEESVTDRPIRSAEVLGRPRSHAHCGSQRRSGGESAPRLRMPRSPTTLTRTDAFLRRGTCSLCGGSPGESHAHKEYDRVRLLCAPGEAFWQPGWHRGGRKGEMALPSFLGGSGAHRGRLRAAIRSRAPETHRGPL